MFYNITILIVIVAFIMYLLCELNIIKQPVSRRKKALYNLKKSFNNQPCFKTAAQQEILNQHDINFTHFEPKPVEQISNRDSEQTWSLEIKAFIDEFIEPYTNALKYNNHLGCIEKLLDILDKHGECPSVVQNKEDSEFKQYANIISTYDALKRISLLNHSLNVAKELINFAKSKKDYQVSIGKWLILGLAHDIGKIPEFRTGAYTKGDHPILSRSLLEDILPKNMPAREDMLNAVRDHHYPNASSESTVMLRKADFNARSIELKSVAPAAEVGLHTMEQQKSKPGNDQQSDNKPKNIDLTWMDKNEFLKQLEDKINVMEHGIFRAFSMKDGLVYFWLETLSDVVIKLAKEENRLNVIAEKKRNIEYSVRVMFDEFVPGFIGGTYPGAKFHLKNIDGKTLNYALLLPLRAEIFKCHLEELEQRKKDRLLKIHEVEPLVRKKT